MRVMLVLSSAGLSTSAGGIKANLALATALHTSGHATLLVGHFSQTALEREGFDAETVPCAVPGYKVVKLHRFRYHGISVVGPAKDEVAHFLDGNPDERALWLQDAKKVEAFEALSYCMCQIAERFKPTHVIFNEGVSVKISSQLPPSVVRVFICHAVEHLPFGPFAGVRGFGSGRSQRECARLKSVDSIVAVSNAVKNYIEKYGSMPSVHIPNHPALYGEGPFPDFSENFDAGKFVSCVNGGVCKGFCIIHDLVQKMRDVQFGVVLSWSVDGFIRRSLETQPNVVTLAPFSDINELFRVTKLLLVPSLWFEAFGLVVVEAMLRGVPVISSNAGGLPEAHLGVDYVLQVNPIVRTKEVHPSAPLGEEYDVPPQDTSGWIATIRKLLADREHYRDVANKSRAAAHQYIQSCDRKAFERHLLDLQANKIEARFLENAGTGMDEGQEETMPKAALRNDDGTLLASHTIDLAIKNIGCAC